MASDAVKKLAPNFEPQGWLDANTLIGLIGVPPTTFDACVGIMRVSDPLHPEDWGYSCAHDGLVS